MQYRPRKEHGIGHYREATSDVVLHVTSSAAVAEGQADDISIAIICICAVAVAVLFHFVFKALSTNITQESNDSARYAFGDEWVRLQSGLVPCRALGQ